MGDAPCTGDSTLEIPPTVGEKAASPQPGVAPPRAGDAPYKPAGDDA